MLLQLLARTGKTAEARALEPVAAAAVERAGNLAAQRWRLEGVLALRQMYDQEPDAGIERLVRLLDTTGSGPKRTDIQVNLARAYGMAGKYEAGLRAAEASLPSAEEVYGPSHPETADRHHVIAQFRKLTGDLAGALGSLNRALAIQERVFGPDHLRVARTLHTLGNVAYDRGDLPAALRAYERAAPIMERAGDARGAGLVRGSIADVIATRDGIDAARPLFLAALDGLGKAVGTDQDDYLQLAYAFAAHLIAGGKCDEAAPWLAIPALRELAVKCK